MCGRYLNATDLVAHIDGLRPNTQYVFVVRVINGRRQSEWSMSVTNTTFEAGMSLPSLNMQSRATSFRFKSTVIFGRLSARVYKPHPLIFQKILILSTYRPHWFISRTYDTREQSIQHTPEPQQKWRTIKIAQTRSLAKQIGILCTCFWIIKMIRECRTCSIVYSA